MRYETFKNPGNEYRGKPFWSWNGELDKDELIRQIHVMKEMGFGGFFMHSRTGLITEYLGKEWFELINACADEAEKLGMEAWLYDEDRWPSGSAGGMVTQKEENQTKYLRVRQVKPEDYPTDDGNLAVFAANLDGINLSGYKKISTKEEAEGYNTILEFKMVPMDKDSFYNGFTYLDTINKDATMDFIKATHEKYQENCGDRIGTTIKGIFTDEPHHGAVIGGFGLHNPESNFCLPFTYKFAERFQKTYGYDLMEKLPELYYRLNGEEIAPIKWQYMEQLQQMFLDNFVIPLEDWCSEHNMALTGHFLHEDTLMTQAIPFGSIMRGYEHMHQPGVDVLTEGNRQYCIVKQLQSAARQTGKTQLLSELYGCTGWQMNFQSHKAVGDWQALYGINVRCHHLSWYTMEGEAKRDYPASILHQSTWYKEYKTVEDYFARLGVVMTQGKPCCDVLYVTPIESTWAEVGIGWANGLSTCYPELQKIEEIYANTWFSLMTSNTDFDFGDEDMMGRLGSIKTENGQPVLVVGNAQYKQVLISGMRTMRRSTFELLKQFKALGGRVVFAGEAPAYIDCLATDEVAKFAEGCVQIGTERDQLVEAFRDNASNIVRASSPEVLMQIRRDGDDLYVLMFNNNRGEALHDVTISFDFPGYLQKWDALTGERYALGKDVKELTLDFAPSQEYIFVIKAEDEGLAPEVKTVYKTATALDTVKGYSLDEPNILVLDMADYQIDSNPWVKREEVLRIDRKVREHYSVPYRGGEMIQPWYAGKTEHKKLGRITLKFTFDAEYIPASAYLVMERPEFFDVSINGKAIDTTRREGFWIDNSFIKLPLTGEMLKKGQNDVTISAMFDESLNLEALYLIGDFGVTVNGNYATMTELPKAIGFGQLYEQGLPFYTGKVTYHLEAPKVSGKAKLVMGDFEGACVVVNPDTDKKVIPWRPLEAELENPATIDVQLVLTRRNTFGPLHEATLRAGAYGPGNFTTGDNDWTYDDNFYPAGIFEAPTLYTE